MRAEWKLIFGMGFFMLPLGVVYWFTSYEVAGSLLLIVVSVAFMFLGAYLRFQSKRMGGLRPEDVDAELSLGEGVGEVGSFPAASIYPFLGAMALTTIGYGLVFTTVLVVPGLALLLLTVVGMARESSLGDRSEPPANGHQTESGTHL